MQELLDELFKSVRAASSPLTWSRGVELSRGDGVVAERISDAEAVLRVASPERVVSATVKLGLEDEDWLCDCGSRQDPCEHIAAAVIALRRAREAGKPLTVVSVSRAILVYAFSTFGDRLGLERLARAGESEAIIESSLSAVLSGRGTGPALSASKEDFAADTTLAGRRGVLPESVVRELLTLLRGHEQVTLDGRPVEVGPAETGFRLLLADVEGGVSARVDSEPRVSRRFANGALVVDGKLCPRAPLSEVAAGLRESRVFGTSEIGELAATLLPQLRQEMPVETRSSRLPETDLEARPRLVFQTSASGDMLSALPLVVYGDPPFARVDSGRLVLLGDGRRAPVRNKAAEARLSAMLHSELGLGVGRKVEYRGDAAVRFSERLSQGRIPVLGGGLRAFASRPELSPRLRYDDGQFGIGFVAADGKGWADPARVLEAWREGLNRVPLVGEEGWAPIPREWLDRYGHRVLDLLEARDREGTLPLFARPELARLCADLDIDVPPDLDRLRRQLDTFTGIAPANLPADLQGSLRSYQRRGVDWLAFLKSCGLGALLADDMGLGKTLQTIAVLSGRSLIVAPTSVLPNWQKELARFRPRLAVCTYHGGGRKIEESADVVLTTYALLRLDVETLAAKEWENVVLDEAQNIKNPESQVSQAAYRLRGSFRLALTGTPIENRLEDLWSLFRFLNPGLLGGRSDFQGRYVSAPGRLADLRAKVKPFILRRLKQEVAPELPPRTDVVLHCELDAEEQKVYDTVRAATRREVLETLGGKSNVLAALESLLRLRQAACHPALLPGQVATSSSKIRLLLERIEEVVGEEHKALVFSQWTSLLDLIEPHLRASGIRFCRIDGSTANRGEVVETFQSSAGPPVLLMTLKAGGVGLNLTAADYVFLVDPWWNPAAEEQAADRAHRIGQDRPVFVHRLVSRGTVEEKILALQESKRSAATAMLQGSEAATTLTRDDLMHLLS